MKFIDHGPQYSSLKNTVLHRSRLFRHSSVYLMNSKCDPAKLCTVTRGNYAVYRFFPFLENYSRFLAASEVRAMNSLIEPSK